MRATEDVGSNPTASIIDKKGRVRVMLFYELKCRWRGWLESLEVRRTISEYLYDNYSAFDVITGRWAHKPTIQRRLLNSRRMKYCRSGYRPPVKHKPSLLSRGVIKLKKVF